MMVTLFLINLTQIKRMKFLLTTFILVILSTSCSNYDTSNYHEQFVDSQNIEEKDNDKTNESMDSKIDADSHDVGEGINNIYQKNGSLIKTKIDSYIKNIEENKKNYKKVQTDLKVQSTEGGMVVAYYENEILRYISSSVFGELSQWNYKIYFIDESLTYFVETKEKYNKPFYMEGSKVVQVKEKPLVILENKWYKFCGENEMLTEQKKMTRYESIFKNIKESLNK